MTVRPLHNSIQAKLYDTRENRRMTHFPVTNSNLPATHIGLFLQEKYFLSKDTQCQLIKAGINDRYLGADNLDKFVFRV